MTNATPRRRKMLIIAAVAASLLALVAAFLPALLSTRAAKARIVARINRVLAPGFLEVDALRLGWAGPTRLESVTLLDPKGKEVVAARSATLDRGLWALLTGGLGQATLTLDDAALDIERKADGTLDLGRALSSLIAHPDPRRDVTVKVAKGTLRYRDPMLARPATADQVDLSLRLPASPNPVSWTFRLGLGDASLEGGGSLDRWNQRDEPGATRELRVDLRGHRWPIASRVGGVDASGQLDGTLDFARRRGLWRLAADARLLGVEARGEPLRGDTLALDRVDAGWDLEQGPEGWSIRRLGISGGFGSIKAEGSLEQAGRRRIEGRLDLAAIARHLPHALRLREGLDVERGTARLEIDSSAGPSGATTWDAEARIVDLAARDGDRALTLRDPATLSARVIQEEKGSGVERLSIQTSFLDASARGKIADGVALEGTLDLAGLRAQLGEWVDLGRLDLGGKAVLSGQFRAKGDRYDGRIKAEVRDLRILGMAGSPIHRDAATLEAGAVGPASGDGTPSAPDRISLALRSAGTSAGVDLQARESSWDVSARASTPVATGDHPSTVEARLAGAWSPGRRVLDLAPVSLSLARDPADSPVMIEGRGRYDHGAGTLVLGAVPGATGSRPIALAPEGVRVSGIGRGLADLHASATLTGDLPTLARALDDQADAPEGRWSALFRLDGDGDGAQVAARIGLDTPSDAPGRATAATLSGRYEPEADRLDVAEITVASPYGALDASGRLDGLGGRRQVDLKGTLAPDFAAITAWLGRRVEARAKIAGEPRPFRAKGSLESGGFDDLDAELGLFLSGVDVFGMQLGPTPITLHANKGRFAFDPISTTLNEGHIRLEPELDLDGAAGPTLRLGKNSTIRDARINDEVSRRVLAFVAPILVDATTATGRVSIDLDHAEFPLTPGHRRSTRVEGAVVFSEVEFAPGPLADQLVRAVGRTEARLRLDQPVTLTIADGRVNQRGLAVPIGNLTRVELDGWVDFDRHLSLTASLPVTSAMLGDNPLLADIAAGTRVALPIGGTLDRPEVDREALSAHLKDLGKTLLTRGAARGAVELLRRLGQPRDPDAPPPPPRLTPEERKARRLEKKAERRGDLP